MMGAAILLESSTAVTGGLLRRRTGPEAAEVAHSLSM